MEFTLPNKKTVIEIHDTILGIFGGLSGVPHPELIESSLARPQHHMAYAKRCDIHLVAALILHGFTRNHAFSDGNKRTALMATIFTYNYNGVKLDFSLAFNNRFERLVLDIAGDNPPELQRIRTRLRKLIKDFETTA